MPVDDTAPEIINVTPIGRNIPIQTNITFSFNEFMNYSSINEGFSILPIIKGYFSKNGKSVYFNPINDLLWNTTYFVTINRKVKDIAGNPIKEIFVWNFTTIIYQNNMSDKDNDGLPDDWGNSNNLNSNNSDDANYDADQDGLSNIEEYNHGTDPFNEDTDNDGLTDGDEIHKFETNATNSDSDGDGHSDSKDDFPTDSTKWKKGKSDSDYETISSELWILLILIITTIIINIALFIIIFKPQNKTDPQQYKSNKNRMPFIDHGIQQRKNEIRRKKRKKIEHLEEINKYIEWDD